MSGSQRDWSGLLYLPDEALVRSTIDGDDADWSESFSYAPPDSLIDSVLDASVREQPAFRFPSTLMPHSTSFGAPNRARRTAALLAALGLSPISLAAAAMLHVAFLFVVGPWVVTQTSAARSIRPPHPPQIVETRLVYVRNEPPPVVAPPGKRPRTARPRSFAGIRTGTAITLASPPLDSARARASESKPSGSAEREVANALSQELFFARDGYDLETPDRQKLELIVRVLNMWPGLRVRVLGAAPRRREGGGESLPGIAEAAAVKRSLVQAGVDSARIEIGQVPEAERFCPEREPLCAAARRRVRTMVAPSP